MTGFSGATTTPARGRKSKMRSLASNLGCVVRHMNPLPGNSHHNRNFAKDVPSREFRASATASTVTASAELSLAPRTVENLDSILVTSTNYTGSQIKNHRRKKGLRKTVRFDSGLSRIYKSKISFTEEDSDNLWFSRDELTGIKKEHMELVREFFKSRRRVAKDQQEQKAKLQQQEQKPEGESSEESNLRGSNEPQNADSTSSATPQDTPEEYWKDTLQRAYKDCRQSEATSTTVDRDSLAHIYRKYDDLLGMEKYVLFMLRGDVTKQIKKLLNSVDQFELARIELNGEEAFVRQCCAMTQPSMAFVQELALAQRTALYL